MSTDFEKRLNIIRSNSELLENAEERAVEVGVVLPLLRCAGWDTGNLRQVYPQKPVTEAGKVDYELKVEDDSRVFIEAKRWRYDITDENDDQIREYCDAGKPRLAVFTNGRHWRLYLPPFPKKRKAEAQLFLEIDIMGDEEDEVERSFMQFLSRANVEDIGKTVTSARKKLKERRDYNVIKGTLTDSLKEWEQNGQLQNHVLSVIAESLGLSVTEAQIKRIGESLGSGIRVVSDRPSSGTRSRPKPRFFTLSAAGVTEPVPIRHWGKLQLAICNLMYERHPDTFREIVLSKLANWFSESDTDFKYYQPIGETGIYVKYGGSAAVRNLCHSIVASFRYPEGSLTIEEKG